MANELVADLRSVARDDVDHPGGKMSAASSASLNVGEA